jgi:tRNA-2-methylthio-N6-dimethylallyladenosine synthase
MGITTDLIVGFPGETEEDFEETLDLVRQVGFDNAYIFKYSPRQNTPAADLPGQVPNELIEERHQRTLQLVNEIGGARYAALTGREVEILVEGPSKRNPARMMGRTRCNKIVVFDGNDRHRGQTMRVRVTKSGSFTLYGDPAILNLD